MNDSSLKKKKTRGEPKETVLHKGASYFSMNIFLRDTFIILRSISNYMYLDRIYFSSFRVL